MQVPGMRCRDCGRSLKPFEQQHCFDCKDVRHVENALHSGLYRSTDAPPAFRRSHAGAEREH